METIVSESEVWIADVGYSRVLHTRQKNETSLLKDNEPSALNNNNLCWDDWKTHVLYQQGKISS